MPHEEGRMNSLMYIKPEKNILTILNYTKTISKRLSKNIPRWITSN